MRGDLVASRRESPSLQDRSVWDSEVGYHITFTGDAGDGAVQCRMNELRVCSDWHDDFSSGSGVRSTVRSKEKQEPCPPRPGNLPFMVT